ncbi:hypothetical protein SK128_024235, partial [Halocaridina rubra]
TRPGNKLDYIEKLEKSRATACGWVTTTSRDLRAMLDKPKFDVSCIELEDELDESDRRISTLDDVQSSYELEIDDPEKLDKEIDLAFHLHHETRQWRVKDAQLLAEMVKGELSNNQTSQGSDFGGSSNKSNAPASVRLPKLELPKFHVEFTEWQSFWDRFVALVDDTNLPVINKFS